LKKASKNVGMYIILIVLVVSLVNVFLTPDGNKAGQTVEVLPYSQFLNEVDLGNVTKVKIDREQLKGTLKSGKEFTTYILDPGTLPSEISKKGVEVEVVPPPKNSWLTALLTSLLPTLLQGFIVVVTVRAAAGELRRRTAGEWLDTAGGSAAVAVLGKLLPYTLVFFCVSLLMWTVSLQWYGAPMRGDWRVLAGATALFVLAYQSMGLLFAALTANIRIANSLAGFYCGPAFAVAGVTFPAAGLSAPAVVWSLGLPLTHYLRIVLQQCMQGAPPASALAPMAALCAFAFLPPLVSVPRLGRLLRDPSAWGRL